MTAERMHINEAVRTYNKTRQTFYNRIKKGYLHSKKINNKIYIATQDVEQLLSDYIGAPSVEETLETEEHNSHNTGGPDDEMFYELIAQLEQQKHMLTQKIDDQKIGFIHEINLTKQELRTDIQRAAEGVQQQWHVENAQAQQQLLETQHKMNHLSIRLLRANKRQYFWLGYALFVLVNITLLTILS